VYDLCRCADGLELATFGAQPVRLTLLALCMIADHTLTVPERFDHSARPSRSQLASVDMSRPSTALVVFARLPVPGKAKTRLAVGVGPEAAAGFYKLCAELIFYSASR
jgi:hypothetical protein